MPFASALAYGRLLPMSDNTFEKMDLKTMIDLAKESSSELAWILGAHMIDYETGHQFDAPNTETAAFIASARSIVLELARRVGRLEDPYSVWHKTHWNILKASTGLHGHSIMSHEFPQLQAAEQLVTDGYMVKEVRPVHPLHKFYYVTLKGLKALEAKGVITNDVNP